MKAFVLLICVGLIGCSDDIPDSYTEKVVVEVGDCTESTGGWGGMTGRCRVFFEDGSRATVRRPVSIGDTIRCLDGRTTEWDCKVK